MPNIILVVDFTMVLFHGTWDGSMAVGGNSFYSDFFSGKVLNAPPEPFLFHHIRRSYLRLRTRELRAIVFHDMTSVEFPLTVSAPAFQNQDGGSFTKLWIDFLIKIFHVGKIYADQNTPGNIIINNWVSKHCDAMSSYPWHNLIIVNNFFTEMTNLSIPINCAWLDLETDRLWEVKVHLWPLSRVPGVGGGGWRARQSPFGILRVCVSPS